MRRILILLLLGSVGLLGDAIPLEEHSARRERLRKEIDGGILILMGSTEPEHGDLRTPFFQESNFQYLTGWSEPGAILVAAAGKETLFIPPRDEKRERWTGAKADPHGSRIQELTGFTDVRPAGSFEADLPGLVEGAGTIYTLLDEPYSEKLRALLPLRPFDDAAGVIGRLRMKKSAAELALLRRSIEVTIEAHRAAWKRMEPGLYEYQIAATMSNVYFDAGCGRHAYAPIVGSGPNSVILHYSRNSRRIDAGELVLMDAGAECAHYAADITRTVPVTGKFSKRQREIYKIVLGAQAAVIAAVKPGMSLGRSGSNSLYTIGYDYINSHGKDRNGERLGQYFTHGIGHHVGLDVHDANDPSEALAAGMVITIEPGIYIPEENIGIRIEDMVLVTGDGAQVLTPDLPREIRDIERAVRKGS